MNFIFICIFCTLFVICSYLVAVQLLPFQPFPVTLSKPKRCEFRTARNDVLLLLVIHGIDSNESKKPLGHILVPLLPLSSTFN